MGDGVRPAGRVVISICGASGSGKSQVALAIVSKLGDEVCVRVPTDYFLLPVVEPICYDWALLDRILTLPDGTAASTPDFDFETFQRIAEVGGKPFVLRPIVIIDAMFSYPGADVTILLAPPAEIRKARIAERDKRWGTNVVARWEQLERARRHLQSMNVAYDLEMSGVDGLDETAETVVTWLKDRIAVPDRF